MYEVYVFMYVCMHQFCNITTNMRDFVPKYLCNFITELHNVTNWSSTEPYCSSCSVPTCYSNVNWPDSTLTVCSQLSVSFCTARRNNKEAHYAISWQLNCTWRGDTSLTAEFLEFCVIFKCIRSGAATSSVTSFVCSAASGTVSSTVHKLYCRCVVFKYSTVCSTVFSSVSTK